MADAEGAAGVDAVEESSVSSDEFFRRKKRKTHEETEGSLSVWYRHSGEKKIQDIPYKPWYRTFQSEGEITTDIGNHHITHMAIENGVIPNLDVIAPKLTHLKIEGVNQFSQLQCMSQLSQLGKLDLSRNNFSAGLPAVIGEINSLNVLHMTHCKLTTLPESMSQLTQLRVLKLPGNNFSAGLPAVIGEINSLNELNLRRCNLTTLPERLHNLKQLKVLELQFNEFEQLPSVIFKLTELNTLNLFSNPKLKRIDDDFLHLTKLTYLDCDSCRSLVYPLYAVCEQGLEAVRKFLIDIRSAKGIERTVVPVAIIGQSMSGKSSLVRSLKTGKRTLTYREPNSPLDETTKVFQVEDLHLQSSQLKLIDFGGNEVYHIAYRMMIKEQYLPLVVVNLEEFSELSSTVTVGPKEATKKVCLDWLAHLYLACPRLGRPILVITHVDKLSCGIKTHIEELLKQAEVIRQDVLDEERVHRYSFQEVIHLSNTQIPLFAPEDIYEFGDETTTTSNIQSLKNNLEERSKEFNVLIPHLWEELASSVHGHLDIPYMSISDITSKYSGEDCLVILRYMHNIGDILWFENIDGLRGYLFHQLPAITEMVAVLFHHCSEDQWKTRLANFTPFPYGNQLISKDKYGKLIKEFISSGIIDKSLLLHLLETESKFSSEVALELLKCFCIVHGPIKKELDDAYIIPFFAPDSKDDSWKSDGPLQLRLDMVLRGLTLPKYVHQLLTVTVLNHTLSSTNTIEVANNGTTIYHGENTTHLVHDFVDHKVTLQISTPVDLLGDSWKRLIDTAKPAVSLLSQEWKACHASFKFYCSHCLFLNDPNPDNDVNPSWFRPVYDYNRSDGTGTSVHTESFQGIQPVTCSRDAARNKSKKPTVPQPLKFPCLHLDTEEKELLSNYLSEETRRYHGNIGLDTVVGKPSLSLNSELEPRRERNKDSGLSDTSATFIGDMKIGPLTEHPPSASAAADVDEVVDVASLSLDFELGPGNEPQRDNVTPDTTTTSTDNTKIGPLTEHPPSASTAAGNIQSISTAAGNIQSTSSSAGNIQSTSTAPYTTE